MDLSSLCGRIEVFGQTGTLGALLGILLGLVLLLIAWFFWFRILPNYENKADRWWGPLLDFPLLGRWPPFRGRPEPDWRFRTGSMALVLSLAAAVALIGSMLSLFGI
jgi:hypothetical protein